MKAEESHVVETFAADTRLPQWKTYRTRFLVKAKQLTSSLAFTDSLGRRHAGRKGDYLVESSDGVLSIAPRQIFEDIYVSMQSLALEPVAPQEVSSPCPELAAPHFSAPGEPVRLRRKLPQPCTAKSSSRWPVVSGQRVVGVQKPVPSANRPLAPSPWPLTTSH